MLGPSKHRDLDRPTVVSLERLVPPDHFYRHLDGALDLSFVRSWVAECYATSRWPSIDPVMSFRFQLIMFFEGIRSERQLVGLVSLNLAHRWYLAYDLYELLPDRSGLVKIRQRLGLAVVRHFFEQIVDLCEEADLIWGREILADATRVPGKASMDSLVPRLKTVVDDHLVELFEARMCADQTTDDTTQWDLLETCRLDPQRPPSGPYRRVSDRKVSCDDPDAASMQLHDGRTVLDYQDHYLVDAGKARITLHAFVTPGDVAENVVLLDQLYPTMFRRNLHPKRVIADAKHATTTNIRTLEDAGIRAYVPLSDWDERFKRAAFTDDPVENAYRCPQGERCICAGPTARASSGSTEPVQQPATRIRSRTSARRAARIGCPAFIPRTIA